MQKEPREAWAKRVEQWQQSGLSAKAFAAREGVSWHALKNWKHRLTREDSGRTRSSTALVKRTRTSPSPASETRPHSPLASLSFVELSLPADPRFELQLPTGVFVRVPQIFDQTALGSLLSVLEGRR